MRCRRRGYQLGGRPGRRKTGRRRAGPTMTHAAAGRRRRRRVYATRFPQLLERGDIDGIYVATPVFGTASSPNPRSRRASRCCWKSRWPTPSGLRGDDRRLSAPARRDGRLPHARTPMVERWPTWSRAASSARPARSPRLPTTSRRPTTAGLRILGRPVPDFGAYPLNMVRHFPRRAHPRPRHRRGLAQAFDFRTASASRCASPETASPST